MRAAPREDSANSQDSPRRAASRDCHGRWDNGGSYPSPHCGPKYRSGAVPSASADHHDNPGRSGLRGIALGIHATLSNSILLPKEPLIRPRSFLTAAAVVPLAYALGLLLVPEWLAAAYSVEANANATLMARFYGGHYWR